MTGVNPKSAMIGQLLLGIFLILYGVFIYLMDREEFKGKDRKALEGWKEVIHFDNKLAMISMFIGGITILIHWFNKYF